MTAGTSVPRPPLPSALQTLGYGLWPQRYLHWCARRLGDRFTLELPVIGTVVVLSDPTELRDLLGLGSSQFTSDATVLEPFLGSESLLCQGGVVHDRQRRLLARALRPDMLRGYGIEMERIVREEIATWPAGRVVQLHPRFQRVTLEIILRVVFGVEDPKQLDPLRSSLRRFLRMAGSLVVLNPGFRRELWGLSAWARFRRRRAEVEAALEAEIARRRALPDVSGRTDVLSVLLAAEHEGERLSDQEILDNLLTMVLAGHDTTATALAWAFDLLLHSPEVMARLLRELAGGDAGFLKAVIQEALRLRPVIVDTSRMVTEEVTIGSHVYPAGTVLVASILLAHHRPDVHPDPMAFRPERFLAQARSDSLTWLPFGGGVRRCLGAGFAMLEMEVVMRAVLLDADLVAARAALERQRRRAVTLVPSRGVRVIRRG